ncbi:prolyl oligopeptidase family serine peptidase [Sorangium sp. So ce1014]|uniref:S9 family peptidase n=1 Tax=Sorangium sp. So ce1014 TaxID=3133326 RepID=UPI003F63F629
MSSPSTRRWRHDGARFSFLGLLALSAACAPASSAPAPAAPRPVAPAPPVPSVSAGAPRPAPAPERPGYEGHGAASVSPEILARYAPPPLPDDVSRRIQLLLDVRAPSGGVLGPDGKALYFTWTITGTRQVFRLDGPQRFPLQLTGGEDPTLVQDVTPGGAHLVLSRDRKGEENPGLYLQDVKGGPLLAIQHKPGVQTQLQFVSDDGRHVYYRANDVKKDAYAIYRYDIASKQRELVFDREGIWRAVDAAAGGRLLLARDVGSNMSEFYEWAPGAQGAAKADPAAGALTPLFGQGEREDYRAMYGAAPGEVLVLTPRLGEYRRLYSWKAGKLTPLSPELPFDVSAFSIDRARKRILYTVNERGHTRLRALDARSHREVKLPALPAADHVVPVATTPNGRFTTLLLETSRAPAASYVLDWTTGKLTQWHTPSMPEIAPDAFAAATLESYPARDGTQIPMFVRRPARCERPCPVIVHFHGGPESQIRAGFSARAQIFVDAGFVFVEPNVRGSDGYGKTWLHADDGAKRLDIITDIEDAAKFVRASFGHEGRPPKVGIFGGSYGGYSALLGMTMFAGAYDAGAAVVGMSDLVTFLQNTAPYRRILRISEYGDPDRDREALIKLSPITYLDRVKAPLLIVQGVTDPRVPAGESVQIQRALEAKKIPSELILFADEGHGAQKRDNQVLQYGHLVRFFRTHLGGR